MRAQKEREHDLEHRAMHDPLTGLPNLALLLDRLTQETHAARRKARRQLRQVERVVLAGATQAQRIVIGVEVWHVREPPYRHARAEARRTLIGSGDRSQRIRTYNFPQNRVTDHRVGLTLYNLDRIILGDLEPLTSALIDHDRKEQLGAD